MKKILLTFAVLFVALLTMAQSPNLMNYQGVARNAAGNVLPNQNISLRLSILTGTPTGAVVYSETRTLLTNAFGLFNVVVGSAGATNVTGTIAGINWTAFGAGSGNKYLQVEIDPVGGSSFVNVGSTQLVSAPYALNAGSAAPVGPAGGDLTGTYPNPTILIPFLRTQAVPANTMIGMTNSATTGTLGAIQGTSASTDANAVAVQGTISSTAPGGFSTAIKGVNNGTGGLGIGVTGTQAGSGWGVYGTTPNGIGVYGLSTAGFGVYGQSTSGVGVNGTSNTANAGAFQNTNTANTTSTLVATSNGSGAAVEGTNTGLGRGGFFQVLNPASVADAVRAETNGTGASWGIRAISSGTNGAGLFQQTNAANTSNNIQSNQGGLGRAGLFQNTLAANAANALEATTAGTGFAVRAASTNAVPKALLTAGGVQLTGIGEANNFVLKSDAAGNGTWVDPAVLLPGANFWSRNAPNLFATNLTDNVGIGTNTPAYKLQVVHAGANGLSVSSTASFSVIDLNAANGDAALRYQNAGSTKWNVRNAPGTNDYQIVRNNSLPANVTINNGTGFVGITQATPAYQLDVLHTGANGIRSQSSASFSVVDIDAANGDAALRFQKAGAGQWNTRNRPADDYYEIFELGGGGSRFVIQDATGFVGIGGPGATASPAYQLDVEHGGATGIRSKSTGTFSVVDIDAANGDAALRFQKAGAGMWNTRNRPADDYFEIFELGGGGSRMVIQDGTGNVGIGETTNPTYRLDVLHGGSTGIRSRSSSSFSVVDIDGASGDAALRFIANGVNQWNTRNRPADNYYEIFELGGGGSRMVIQDGTGNVGIGETTNPTYKLDVLHGGATGIRSRSSGTFSVIDIDGANGDAALRLQKAGVNQWNLRNRPADDYFEIFELNGGGSRMVIQDGSGNVGIGETTNPVYKLDVLHGGATGIRSRSSGTFSVVDIDGANGDAALRFQKAGVSQWNTRNNPATDDYQIFELGGGGERMRIENTTGKVVVSGDFTALGVKAFTMDYPLDPTNKTLMHAAVESNEVLNSYSGNVVTDASGKVTVTLPEYFEAINKDFRYQLTVVGGTFAQAMVSKEISNNKFEIATNQPNVKVSWEVKGVRNDARMKMNPFSAVQDKPAAQRGKYLDPKSYNQPESKGVSFDGSLSSSINDIKPSADKKVTPPTTGGSLDQGPITKPNTAKMDNSGSVSDVAPAKAADKKLEINGSVLDTPAAKPVDKKLTNDGSVAPDTKKQEVKPVAKPTGAQSVNG